VAYGSLGTPPYLGGEPKLGDTMSTEEFRILLGFLGAMAALGTAAKVILTWMKRPRAPRALPVELTELTYKR
jgi:hypothetical protein